MKRPRLLDLFCGAGGAAMGYHRAGFDVVGMDIRPQPRYPFGFILGDALEQVIWAGCFDAVHASPPCQRWARTTPWRGRRADHPDLVTPTRLLLERAGVPWVLENVRGSPAVGHVVLCGSMFGLGVRRHRVFETSWNGWDLVSPCQHAADDLGFHHVHEAVYRDALGCGWMTTKEARQAIPPAYTEWIGQRLLEQV